MALSDYICCKDCGCKVIYDGDDTHRDSLEELWGNPDVDYWTVDIIRCKPCFDKNEAEMTRLRQRVEELEAGITAALPGVHYMDMPDGGSPSLAEQLQRMASDAERWREMWALPPDRFQIVLMQIYNGVSPDAAIDAAMEEGR